MSHKEPVGLEIVSDGVLADQQGARSSGDTYLFASRLTHQLQTYASQRPDLTAIATDALFPLDWTELRAYASPPWIMIGKVLDQTRRQQAELVLVAPVWKARRLEPGATGDVGGHLTPDPPEQGPDNSHTQGQTPRGGLPISRMGYLRQHYQDC